MTQTEIFFKLLKEANELKKNSTSLSKKDPEKFNLLLNFSVIIENNLHYSEKQEYLQLVKSFLTDQIDADDFSSSFIALYEGINQNLAQMKKSESVELTNFLKGSRPELGELLARIHGACDSFSLDPTIALSDKKELKDCALSLLLKLQE
jgi:hypothetical protein